MDIYSLNDKVKRLVVVGSGFGGIEVIKRINTHKFEVLLLDKHNYLTFQPLLYQVATGGLEPDSVAYPVRKIISGRKNIVFRMAEVLEILPDTKQLNTNIGLLSYDVLVLACGSVTNFFGLDQVKENALSLKSVTDALNMRSFILQNFEKALLSTDKTEQKRLMNFVIVGGGPTGVEVSGSLAELKRHVLPHDYPELDISMMEIAIAESGNNVLEVMSDYAKRNSKMQLEELGVNILTNHQLISYDGKEAVFKNGNVIQTSALIWTAGVMGNIPGGFSKEVKFRGNRLLVDEFNRVKGLKDIYAIGDIACLEKEPQPMLAPVATQQGKTLALNLNRNVETQWKEFKYFDKGTMATIGRSRAVADLKFIHLRGLPAWLAWLFIHLMLLVGFRNRVIVFINWLWNYFSYDKAIRLIIRPYKKI